MEPTTSAPADWYPDPTGRHQHRYWDGTSWTDWAATNGARVVDQLIPVPVAHDQRDADAHLPQRGPGKTTQAGAYPLLGSDGFHNTEVAGEFARLDAIHRAIGRKPKRDEQIVIDDLTAELRPEPRNPHDHNAVMVIIEGQHVGYLERDVAAIYQPHLLRVVRAGYMPTTGARIWANARADWENPRKTFYGANVRVALNDPQLLLPANDPPLEPHSILPWGNALQVTGEEAHQEVIAPYLAQGGDAVALGTLATVEVSTARTTRKLIEVRIDGHRVGQLSPASSQHFLPTIEHLAATGLLASVWLRVKGSAIATQVTVQATKAHELPEHWFSRANTVPRLGLT